MINWKEVQDNIIGLSVFNYADFNILDVKDFDIEYQETFKKIREVKGNYRELYQQGFKTILKKTELINYSNKRILCLMLIERRFKTLLESLVHLVMRNEESASNVLILTEVKDELNELDIFDLIEGLPWFLSEKKTFKESVLLKFENLKKYTNERVERIQEVY